MPFHLVTVPVAGHDRDLVSLALWEAGAVGVEELPTALRAAFASKEAADEARRVIGGTTGIEEATAEDALEASRRQATTRRAGPFVIHPPWEPAPIDDGVAIEIDPGHAFGSASHPSTRLALGLLARLDLDGATVFDLGCGTGVLAIAAARLGARVLAVDIDPAAVTATRGNTERNSVSGRVEVRHGSVECCPDGVDVLVANLTVDIHEACGPPLRGRAARLVVAGILRSQLARTERAHGATSVASITDGEWVAAELRAGPGAGQL